MKIVVATPLYPPDIAAPAPYVKELAGRLGGRHAITVVAYTRLPEQVPGVRIISVSKEQPLVLRLLDYTIALARAMRGTDIVYAMNGASVELPIILVSLGMRKPLIIGTADTAAHVRAQKSLVLRLLEQLASWRARTVLTALPKPRPEIMPLEPYPTEAFAAYERSWVEHLAELENAFHHA